MSLLLGVGGGEVSCFGQGAPGSLRGFGVIGWRRGVGGTLEEHMDARKTKRC